MSSGRSLAKILLLPPFLAALLYLLASYILFPLYTRWRSHHRTSSTSLSRSLTDRIPTFFTSRRGSASSGGSLLGDEELEEGFLGVDREMNDGRDGDGEEGRLSRELEGGFRDESSDEEEDEGRRGRLDRG